MEAASGYVSWEASVVIPEEPHTCAVQAKVYGVELVLGIDFESVECPDS